MMKKGEMSLQVIVVAVLVLIVLVVLVLVFTGKLKIFGSKTTETTAQYGTNKCLVPGTNNECADSQEECERKGGSFMYVAGGYEDCFGRACCYL